jgi:tungstate transport system substrate-binding protein
MMGFRNNVASILNAVKKHQGDLPMNKFSKTLFGALLSLAFVLPAQAETLMMATTTSTDNSGLLDFLAPSFKAETGIDLKWVAVGTGKALEIAKNCDADVLLVHAPAVEKKFVADGFGVDRRQIMYSDFVILGPKADPAKVAGKTTAEALKAIYDAKAVFVSRGDKSGTHNAEKKLWKANNLPPDQEQFYISAGQGMMATINIAAEKGGYTLTDRATWIKFAAKQGDANPLAIVVEGDKALFNQYSVMTTNPARCANVKVELAKQFEDWWVDPKTQKRIGEYTLEGKQLFFPNAGK